MLRISQLFIYPIKSLGGISLTSATVTDRGLEHDRRWMLVNDQNRFISQRELPELALFRVDITNEGLLVQHKLNSSRITIPYHAQGTEEINVEIWNDVCQAIPVTDKADQWFSNMVSYSCRLVFMPEHTQRFVDPRFAGSKEITSFSDAYPFLLLGQSSLDDLNSRLTQPLPVDRFRPNIVFTGGQAFEEDTIKHFVVNGIHFYGVKPCERCMITTINQETAEGGKEPLKTLSTYRLLNNKVLFGQNLLHKGNGNIKIGDALTVQHAVKLNTI